MEKLSQSSSSFPVDLTREILSRLPDKSVARFRCVSKLWSSITTDPYFIKLFETRSATRPSLLLCFRKEDDDLCVYSIQQNPNEAYSSSSLPIISRYHLKLPEHVQNPKDHRYCYFRFTESVHGLICLQADQKPIVWIWNPSMRRFIPLPNPHNHKSWKKVTLFLGYDPIEGKHKVVCLRYKKVSYVCRVLTLGSAQESWRTVRTHLKHRAYCLSSEGRCINGVIYYNAGISGYPLHSALMSFDVRSEEFHMIEKPPGVVSEDGPINYGGRLACSDSCFVRRNNESRRLWILEHAEKRKWKRSTQDFLVPLQDYGNPEFKLAGFTHAGEFVYVPEKFHRSLCILFYDPVRNSCRRFEFKGIADEESCLDYWYHQYELHVFPNHIESLFLCNS